MEYYSSESRGKCNLVSLVRRTRQTDRRFRLRAVSRCDRPKVAETQKWTAAWWACKCLNVIFRRTHSRDLMDSYSCNFGMAPVKLENCRTIDLTLTQRGNPDKCPSCRGFATFGTELTHLHSNQKKNWIRILYSKLSWRGGETFVKKLNFKKFILEYLKFKIWNLILKNWNVELKV